jgi:hypothetical protein
MCVYINQTAVFCLKMDSSPAQLRNVFSEDYEYFQSNHVQFPDNAATVFGCVADLRTALQSFRVAVKQYKTDSCAEQASEPYPTQDAVLSQMAEPVLLEPTEVG